MKIALLKGFGVDISVNKIVSCFVVVLINLLSADNPILIINSYLTYAQRN